MNKDKWSNVLSQDNAVTYGGNPSYGHEYAVVFLYDLLTKHLGMGGDVRVEMVNGEVSGNLLAGVSYIDIPDSLTAVGGSYPDISLKDATQKPIRVIEIVVTSSPTEAKVRNLESRGVEVIQVKIEKPEDLKLLCCQPVPSFAPDLEVDYVRRGKPHPSRLSVKGVLSMFPMGLSPLTLEQQRNSDVIIERLLKDLENCNPTVRRRLLAVLSAASQPESLYPLSQSNPHREKFSD